MVVMQTLLKKRRMYDQDRLDVHDDIGANRLLKIKACPNQIQRFGWKLKTISFMYYGMILEVLLIILSRLTLVCITNWTLVNRDWVRR